MDNKKKWLWVGVIIALINSLAGVILGLVLWRTEPKLKSDGQLITVIALMVFVVELAFFKFHGPQFP